MNSEEIMDRGRDGERKRYFLLSKVSNYIKKGNKVYLELVEGRVLLEFLSSNIVRILMGERDELDGRSTVALVDHNLSYDDFSIEGTQETLTIKTDTLKIVINRIKFALEFYDLEGNLINADYSKGALGWQKDEVRAWKRLKDNERFYGLGEKTGFLDKRGKEYTMWNTDTFNPHVTGTDPLYQSIPFLIGFEGGNAYGIYFDNSYKTHFDLGKGDKEYYSFWSEGGKLDYYFINGPTLKDVVASYTNLTGRMPIPPKWSIGYHQSRYSYNPEEKVREIAKGFRDRQIPCDAIHLDIHYMDGYKVFTWNEDEFPNPQRMLKDLGDDGFKVVNIVDPGVKKDPEYKIYQEGISNDYFCKYLDGEYFVGRVWPGDCLFPDFSKRAVRRWWGDCHKKLLDVGVRGIWNDMNEPAVFKPGREDPTMDLNVVHKDQGDIITQRGVHNLYGFLEAEATYEGLKINRENERPFVLTRAGFSGIQRYAAVWTGDNRSFWEHLHLTMPMLMNMGLSGIAFSGSDVGGFAYDATGELLARWTQLGCFMPFFRNHSAINSANQEPWAFGEKYEKIVKKYIELRYSFLTHLYNLFYKSSESGLPIMRPLIMEYPEDEKTYNLSDQFMVGDSILVAPIYRPDTQERIVYLPEGEWYDFWTGEIYEGGRSIIANAPIDKMPFYIKAGSIIPLAPRMNYVGEKKVERLELNFYLNNQVGGGEYNLYEDDGISFDYKEGDYNLREISYKRLVEGLEISIREEVGGYHLEYGSYNFKVHLPQSTPREVYLDGEKFDDWSWSKGILQIEVGVSIREVKVELLDKEMIIS